MDSFELTFPHKVLESFTDEEFYLFCQQNSDLKFERTADRKIVIMTPTGGTTGNKGMRLGAKLDVWNEQTNLGYTFDSSTGFILPNSAVRSPDASWVSKVRWGALSLAEQEGFPPLCPDFVIELLSSTDRLADARKKMNEYMANGCEMGWLIDPQSRITHVYTKGNLVEIPFAKPLRGGSVLPGFRLDLSTIF